MRPKIVILTLVVAIGLVALAAVLKTVLSGHPDQDVKAPEAPPEAATQEVASAANPNATNNAAFLEQLRRTELNKELDQVRELQAAGPGNPATTGALLGKVSHREPEVRRAALQALVQLDDTNAIAGLEEAQAAIEDPREKVAVMDAIAYLKLPELAPPAGYTNEMTADSGPTSIRTPRKPPEPGQWKPKPQKAFRGRPPASAQPAVPANPAAANAAPADPAAAPPQ